MRSTADITSDLLISLTESIGELQKASLTLDQQSEELAAAMSEFVESNGK